MKKPIFIFTFFFSVLILLIFFIFPKYQEIADLKDRIEEKTAVLQRKEGYFQNLYDLEKELEGYKESLQKLNTALPAKNPNLPSLFNFLQKAVSENGLVLENMGSFSISSSKTKEELGEVDLELSVLGSYPSFKNLLTTLEKSARLIEVERFSFSSSAEEEIFRFALKIKVYFING